jgi:class 3 adenylate cyclase
MMENILVVDNSEIVTTGLKIKLERAGFKPYIADSKEEAIAAIAEQFIHFFGVIMEPDLDDVDDQLEFIEFMTERRIATVVLSSSTNEQMIDQILDMNIIEFVYKEKEEDLNYAVDMMSRIRNYKEQKVLIVHKDFEFLQQVKKNMEALMFNVLIAKDSNGAKEMFENHEDIKLALISHDLEPRNGFELTLSLRKRYSKEDLIIVAITPLDEPSTTSMFLKYGANGYVSSKCTRDELNYTISNLMDVLHNKEEAIRVKQQIEQYTTQLSKYISPQIYQSIMKGEGANKMEAKRKKLTIFFLHIADFTDISESMESKELTYWLNEYLKRMSDVALKHGATIDKFIGDAVMIFFGAPESNGVAMDAFACTKMALEMQEEMIEFRKEQRADGVLRPFHVKAGISTGFVTVGNFGNVDRMDYTIIGGFVNLAARLEHAAKADTILIPEETYQLVKKFINVKKGDEVFAKGFPNLIQTYEVESVKDEKDLSDESNSTLREVLAHIDRKHVVLIDEVTELLTDISGINDHIRR